MTLLLDELRTYLIAQAIAEGSTGWKIYEGYFPDDQDQMIGLFETGGYPSDTHAGENLRATFQTRVRCARFIYATGRQKAEDILTALQNARQTTVGPTTYLSGFVQILAMQEAPMIFNDDQGRPNFTQNWRVVRLKS